MPKPSRVHQPTIPVWGQVRLPGDTPEEVVEFVRTNHWGRAPLEHADCGVALPHKSGITPTSSALEPKHRLVVLGDSLSHGFQHFAVRDTTLSWGAILAAEAEFEFRTPDFAFGSGMPLNLEEVARTLGARNKPELPLRSLPSALIAVRRVMAKTHDTWQRGDGRLPSYAPTPGVHIDALAQWGFDVLDALHHTELTQRNLMKHQRPSALVPFLHEADLLSSARVLSAVHDDCGRPLSFVEGAEYLGRDGGIDTLVVALGANNALGTVKGLTITWSNNGHDDPQCKGAYNLWKPEHFRAVYDRLVDRVTHINARRVVFCTIPHVTIAPIARGVGDKSRDGSRYFPYYTRPWITDARFQPTRDAHLTGAEARAIDATIDCYNAHIESIVRQGRELGHDWHCFELSGLLDQMASRRYINDPSARPPWWKHAPLPEGLQHISPVLDTQFFDSAPRHRAQPRGHRIQGGWFGLDGVHPTTTGYAYLAWSMANMLRDAGVEFPHCDADGTVGFHWERWTAADTLLSAPPASVRAALHRIAQADELSDHILGPARELVRRFQR
ncbi:MAG: hypothetical protein ACOYN3_01345 [Acidimicrobiia bacterium]